MLFAASTSQPSPDAPVATSYSMQPNGPNPDVVLPEYNFAGERSGRYSILVQTPGYLDWSTSNIQVRKDECHVKTVRITARLKR